MKNISAILFLLVFSAFGFAQTQPKTVTDFYLALPGGIYGIAGTQNTVGDSYFENDFFFYANERNESKDAINKYRKSVIKTEDLKNGYLKLESDDWDGWVEIALFKKTDDTYLMALSQVRYMGPGSAGDILFLSYNRGKWTNITESVFPVKPFSVTGYFKLPQVGTTIELICGDERGDESQPDCQPGKKVAGFLWNKTKFVKQ